MPVVAKKKKTTSKKVTAKKVVAKKATVKKAAPKKVTAKKAAPKKITRKKVATGKAAPKKATARKVTAKKAAPKKVVAKKATPKKVTAKKAAPKKVTSKKLTSKKAASKKEKLEFSKSVYLNWYETMYRIRKFEEKTLLAYSKQLVRGFCHVYIGQEAIAAGIRSARGKEDKLVTAYRQHGIALALGMDSNSCMAELFGKETGCVKGKGGSMHFFSKENHYFGGNGIVGAQIPIGTGMALAEKYRKTKNLAFVMFGDGAARQGALYESFNMAMTWKLPVLYICENNHYAMGTSVTRTSNVTDLYKIGRSFEMPSEAVDGMSPEAVHKAIDKAAKHIRAGKGPYYLEIKTYRYKGHSVSDPAKYRTKDELNDYKAIDPIEVTKDKILSNKLATAKEIGKIEASIQKEIDAAFEFASNSDFPMSSALYEDNYVQKDYPYLMD